MFTVVFIQLKIEQEEADITTNAEYVVILRWQDGVNHDVDLWVRDPNNNMLFFKTKEIGIMHLDRDDLGTINDSIYSDGQLITVKTNQEIATIRGFIPGEWVINAHFYRVSKEEKDEMVARCNVTLTKLNPKARLILSENFTLTDYWQEKTVARISMTANGNILSTSNLPKSLVSKKIMR
jgi:hypothetical protein